MVGSLECIFNTIFGYEFNSSPLLLKIRILTHKHLPCSVVVHFLSKFQILCNLSPSVYTPSSGWSSYQILMEQGSSDFYLAQVRHPFVCI